MMPEGRVAGKNREEGAERGSAPATATWAWAIFNIQPRSSYSVRLQVFTYIVLSDFTTTR